MHILMPHACTTAYILSRCSIINILLIVLLQYLRAAHGGAAEEGQRAARGGREAARAVSQLGASTGRELFVFRPVFVNHSQDQSQT